MLSFLGRLWPILAGPLGKALKRIAWEIVWRGAKKALEELPTWAAERRLRKDIERRAGRARVVVLVQVLLTLTAVLTDHLLGCRPYFMLGWLSVCTIWGSLDLARTIGELLRFHNKHKIWLKWLGITYWRVLLVALESLLPLAVLLALWIGVRAWLWSRVI